MKNRRLMNKEYIRRIGTAIDYINKNLDQELNLAIIAKVALYSPFHFHRLFTAVTGENLNKYILRLRIERSALQLKKDRYSTISEIAVQNGFNSNSSFSKAFKNHYGISPSFLRANSNEFSKIRQINSKNGQLGIEISNDLCNVIQTAHLESIEPIIVRDLPAIRVAYLSYTGPYHGIGEAFRSLVKWAKKNNISTTKVITQFHDSPEVTDLSQIRQSACLALVDSKKEGDDILFSTINRGEYAVGMFSVELEQQDLAWQAMIVWVAERGLLADHNRTCYEIYHDQISITTDKKIMIEIFVPVGK